MTSHKTIPASEALKAILRQNESTRCVDVRSPGEFSQGSIPFFANIAILSDQERHEVGICYKEKGQNVAIKLGHSLVANHREILINDWQSYFKDAEIPLLTCWRGGLRSEIAANWLADVGTRVLRVEGGYKGLRRELLQTLEALPEFLVVAGPTGSGKTTFLRASSLPLIDLEALANHRGSAFGGHIAQAQPAQSTFENRIAFELQKQASKLLLIEDESLMIGGIHLPIPLIEKIRKSPVVKFQVSLETRIENILSDYVIAPQLLGIPSLALQGQYENSLRKIEKKIGGLATQQISGFMNLAFTTQDNDLHRAWIRDVLVHYYDKLYAYSFVHTPRKIAFEGDPNECHHWIQKQFA